MNSVLLKSEKASTTLGLTSSHLVDFDRHQGNHIVTHTSPVYTTAKANRRQLIADKGSFDGGISPESGWAYLGLASVKSERKL